jgi:glycosyltransferase involved in cell wall biosynthesis
MRSSDAAIDLVVPTIGRPSLARLLESVGRSRGARPGRVIVVDDRGDRRTALDLGELDDDLRERIEVIAGRSAGPASARNVGWRASRAGWIAFLDDDVLAGETWLEDLAADLRDLPAGIAGSQGRVWVPPPRGRKRTDWERNVAGLEGARWITADCAYRRDALLAAGGFDERFVRAYREDADLALRVTGRGLRIGRGRRAVAHPVRPAPWWISVRLQAGNFDDVLMDALHGPRWRDLAGAPHGAYRAHAVTVAAALAAAGAFAMRRRRLAAAAAAYWTCSTAAFAWRRIAPGPRTPAEVATMVSTSPAIPFAAVYHRLRGALRLGALLADHDRAPHPSGAGMLPGEPA